MFRILGLTHSSYRGIAPITTQPMPLPVGLAKIGKAFKTLCAWALPEDVYDPRRDATDRYQNLADPIKSESPPEWSSEEREHLYDALVFPLDTDSLFEDFSQRDEGNCALVATLKAAIRRYGKKLFHSVKVPERGHYVIALRDGSSVALDEQHLALTRSASGLAGPDSPTKAFATLAYAVAAARRAQLTPAVDLEAGLVDGWMTEKERFQKALRDLGSGHRPRDCATYLGVGNELRIRDVTSDEDITDDSTVITSFSHAVYVQRVDGEMKADHYGRAVEYDGTDTNGRRSRKKLTFEGDGLKDIDGWFYI